MRILVLGAGALGGYFGGRLLEAGADVAFLVRPRRRAQLERDGLVIESPYGALKRPVPLLSPGEAAPGWDAVLLACKAYDLDDAIAAIRPAVDARTAVLPVLNGVSHVETLQRAFGPGRVLGGLAKIQATFAPDGTVRHLNDWRYLTFGEMDGRVSPRVEALAEAAAGAKGVVAAAVPDIAFRMWEKLVHLGTSALCTVLMRANVGEIARAPGGGALMRRVLERNAAVAAAHGHPMRGAFLDEYRAVFSDPASAYSASLLRDLEAGGRIEADHILGFLLDAARRAGVPDELHEAAFLHAKAYERRRDAGRLPGGVPQLSLETVPRATVAMDDKLLERARELTDTKETSALVREALTALIQREAARRLALLGGTMPDARHVSRRRPDPAKPDEE